MRQPAMDVTQLLSARCGIGYCHCQTWDSFEDQKMNLSKSIHAKIYRRLSLFIYMYLYSSLQSIYIKSQFVKFVHSLTSFTVDSISCLCEPAGAVVSWTRRLAGSLAPSSSPPLSAGRSARSKSFCSHELLRFAPPGALQLDSIPPLLHLHTNSSMTKD